MARVEKYYRFILLNSSVRGPFEPKYLKNHYHWTETFKYLITDEVKWAGATISCEGEIHVQTPIIVTDRYGLNIVQEAGSLDCPKNFPGAIRKWEIGSTSAILKAGYNIDSLMTRYDGVDFRLEKPTCNAGRNPALFLSNDGLNLDPFEVMFVKVKSTIELSHDNMVRRYADYLFGKDDLKSNEWTTERIQNRLQNDFRQEMSVAERCGLVFDVDYYARKNNDLSLLPKDQLLDHFKNYGALHRRAHRFINPSHNLKAAHRRGCAEQLLNPVAIPK